MKVESLSKKVIKNTVYNAAGRLWTILIGLLLTPYMINKLGVERYGVWAIVGVLTGYFSILDLGIGSAFVKYISEFYTKNEHKKISQIITTGMVFYMFLGVILIAGGILILQPLLSLFKIPASMYDEASFVFLAGIILFALANPISVFSSLQGGLQRMDISNKLNVLISIPNTVGIIYMLEKGYGLRGLMINNAFTFVIVAVANIIVAYRIFPQLKVSSGLFDTKILRKLFNYGYKLQIARISSMISGQIDKLLIGYYLSVGLITFYQLGSSVIEQAKTAVLLFLSALIPAFSEIDARGDRKKLLDGYTRISKYIALLAIPLFSFIFISSYQLIRVWMGSGYEKAAWIIMILAPGWLFAILSGVRSVLVQAIDKPGIEMKAGIVAAIVNIPLSVFFIIKLGFIGVALGTTIALLCSVVYSFLVVHKELALPKLKFISGTIIQPFIISTGLCLVFWAAAGSFPEIFLERSRWLNLAALFVESLLFFGCYLTLLIYIKPLDSGDRLLLQDKLPRLRTLIIKLCK